MKLMRAFIKLIRFPNLVYILLTQYLLQYCVLIPVFARYGVTPTLSDGLFFLLSLSTVLVAAAGYIINDYFDINIDQVNKPERVIIDRLISRRWAILFHTLFNIVGVALGFWVGWRIGYPLLGMTQLVCSGLLWFYSTSYKRQVLIGNIVISLLTALTVMVVGFYEPQLYREVTRVNARADYELLWLLLCYAGFAFFISMIREIVKDLEDVRGDARLGCRTMPIVYGINASRDVAMVLSWLLIALIVTAEVVIYPKGWYAAVLYLVAAVQLPMYFVIRRLARAEEQAAFHRISSLVKGVMLTGILSILFFKLYF